MSKTTTSELIARIKAFLFRRWEAFAARAVVVLKWVFSSRVFNRDNIGVVAYLSSIVVVGYGAEQFYHGVGWVVGGIMLTLFSLLLDDSDQASKTGKRG